MLIRCGTKLRLLGGRRFIWQVLSPSPELSKPWQNEAIQACADAIDSGCTQVGLHVYGDTYFPSLLLNLLDRIIQQPSPESSPAQPDMRPRTPQVLVLAARMDRAIEIASTIGFNRRRWHIERDTALQKRPSQATVLVSTYPLAVQDDYQHQRLLKRIDLSTLKAIVLTDTEIFQEEPWVVDPPDLPQTPVVYFNDFRGRFLARPRWFAPFKQHSPLVIATTTKGVADLNLLRRLGVEVVYRRTLLDSLAEEWECKPRFMAIPVQSSPSPESTSDSDSTESFSKAICSPEILHATVKAWQDHAAEIRKSTLVYCVDDAHASELEKVFRASDIDARQHKRTDGHKIMDEWSAGKFPILIVSHSDTVWVSRIDCVVLATPPTKNSELYGNRLLSAMSASPETGKEDSLVIELLDADGSPQTDTCDIRTLLQLDASEISGQPLDVLQARAVQLAHLALPAQLDERRRIRKPHTPPATPIVMTTRTGSLHWYQLKEEAEDEDFYYIRKSSPGLHWVRCRIGVYVHDRFAAGHALIWRPPHSDTFEAQWNGSPLAGRAVYGPTGRRLGTPGTALERIMPPLLDFLATKVPPNLEDRAYKASDVQLARLWEVYVQAPTPAPMYLFRRYRGSEEREEVEFEEILNWVTVGEASNALARLLYKTNKAVPLVFTHKEQRDIMQRINLGIRLRRYIEPPKATY